jgi:hypothetical protein
LAHCFEHSDKQLSFSLVQIATLIFGLIDVLQCSNTRVQCVEHFAEQASGEAA